VEIGKRVRRWDVEPVEEMARPVEPEPVEERDDELVPA
jgi:hypothetical protein